jgi:hypothetical protein
MTANVPEEALRKAKAYVEARFGVVIPPSVLGLAAQQAELIVRHLPKGNNMTPSHLITFINPRLELAAKAIVNGVGTKVCDAMINSKKGSV